MTRGTQRYVHAAVAALTLTACGVEAPQMSEGQALFEANCAMCHGERGLGNGPMASTLPVTPPSLMEHLGHHPIDELVRLIRSGVPPAMPPAALSEEQVRLVVDYAWTLVPDSMVAELREMQQMMEMGMDMEMGPDGGMDMGPDGAMPMGTGSDGSMPMPMGRDTTPR